MVSPSTDRRLGLGGNIPYKTPATVVATSNVTQSGEQTIDGIALLSSNAAGVPDRVLCTAQTNGTLNGLWDVSTAAWTRSVDSNGNHDFRQGTQVAIARGSAANQIWILTTADPITIDTTTLTWSQNLSAGFLATLAGSGGSALIGFLQSGTGAVGRTQQDKDRDSVDLADFYGSRTIYGGVIDAASTLTAALAAHAEVHLTGQILLNSQITLASDKRITMFGDGGIIVSMTTFTGGITTSTGAAIVISSATGSQQGIRGGYIRPNTYTDNRACIAIRVLSSSHVTIDDVNFNNWSNADGLINVDSSSDVTISRCRFRDCTSAIGQVSGIVCDNNIAGGIPSKRLKILGNDFLNLRGLNSGAANEQSDGITIAKTCEEYVIDGNTFDTMGEPIDTFGSYGVISNNAIKEATAYGIKLIHGASRNVVCGNTIRNAGIAGIIIAGTNAAAEDAVGNLVFGNNIQGIDSNGYYGALSTACITLDDGAAVSTLQFNVVTKNVLNPSGGKYCINRAGLTLAQGQNWITDNFFFGAGSTGYVKDVALLNTGRITAENRTSVRAYPAGTQNILTTASDKVVFDTESFDDQGEWNTGSSRFGLRIPGLYRISGQVRLGALTTAGSIITLIVKKNGATAISTTAHDGRSNIAYVFDTTAALLETDYVEVFLTNGDTGTVTVQAGTDLSFVMVEPV